jgi:hypothetical protein
MINRDSLRQALQDGLKTCGIGRDCSEAIMPFILDALKQEPAESCLWKEDQDGVWDSSCGLRWDFNADEPIGNGMVFCPRCGKTLTQQGYFEEEEED